MMIITKTDIIKNGIWLTFPPLLFSLSLMTFLPNALTPAQFNEGIPDVLLNIESIGRILVFAMPGDDIVQKPNFVATRAVSIEAPPAEVWKWIIQIGSGRAGFYSIDSIDNANVPSSRDIIPKYQRIEQDYFIPFTPNHKNGMWVKDYREFEYILWWDRKGNGTWGWFLQQTEAGNTRLITRLRTKYDFSFPWIIYYILYDFGDIIMMSKCMSGIKERAENYIRSPILGNS